LTAKSLHTIDINKLWIFSGKLCATNGVINFFASAFPLFPGCICMQEEPGHKCPHMVKAPPAAPDLTCWANRTDRARRNKKISAQICIYLYGPRRRLGKRRMNKIFGITNCCDFLFGAERDADCGCCKLSGWWMWVWPCGNRVTLNYALTRTQNTRSQDQGLCAAGDTVSITVWLATGLKNK